MKRRQSVQRHEWGWSVPPTPAAPLSLPRVQWILSAAPGKEPYALPRSGDSRGTRTGWHLAGRPHNHPPRIWAACSGMQSRLNRHVDASRTAARGRRGFARRRTLSGVWWLPPGRGRVQQIGSAPLPPRPPLSGPRRGGAGQRRGPTAPGGAPAGVSRGCPPAAAAPFGSAGGGVRPRRSVAGGLSYKSRAPRSRNPPQTPSQSSSAAFGRTRLG